MKPYNRPFISFEEIDFNHDTQLIRVDFFDYLMSHKSIYIDFFDFEEWLNKNEALLVENDSFEAVIKFHDLLLDTGYCECRNQLLKDYIKELLNLNHIAENIANQTVIKRLQEEVLTISQELKSMYKLSA